MAQGFCISKTLTHLFGEKMIEIGVRFGVVFWTPDLDPRIGPLFVSYACNKSGAQNGVTFLIPFWTPEIVVFRRSYVFKCSGLVGPFPIDDRCLGMFPTKKPGMVASAMYSISCSRRMPGGRFGARFLYFENFDPDFW